MKLDYDLSACLEYNPQKDFKAEDISAVVAVVEGEHDESSWHWVVRLRGKRFALIVGSCDYTGWDCQSSAESIITNTAIQAAKLDGSPAARYELLEQIKTGKKKTTWRELTKNKYDGRIVRIE